MISSPLGKFFVAIGADTSEFTKEIKSAQSALKKAFGSEAMAVSKNMVGIFSGMVAGAAAFATASMAMADASERNRVGMIKLTGSVEAAKRMLSDLRELATGTTLELPGLDQAARRMLEFGFSAKDIVPTFKTIGDAVITMGGSQGDFDTIVSALTKIQALGVVSKREIKEMIGANIDAYKYLAQYLNTDVFGAIQKVKDGQVTSGVAIKAILSGMNKDFSGSMEAQKSTVLGQMAQMKDVVSVTMKTIGERLNEAFNVHGATSAALKEVQAFGRAVKESGFAAALSDAFGPEMKTAILATAGAITTAMVPALYSMALAGLAAHANMIPLYLAGAAIALAGYAIYSAWEPTIKFINDGITKAKFYIEEFRIGAKTAFQEIGRTALNIIAEVLSALSTAARNSETVFNGLAEPITQAFVEVTKASHAMKNAIAESDKEMKNLNAKWGWYNQAGGAFEEIISGGEKAKNIVAGVRSAFMGFANTNLKTGWDFIKGMSTSPAAPKPSGAGGLAAGDDAARAAKRVQDDIKSMSETIRREWVQNTKTEEEQLAIWYEDTLAALEKNKTANASYLDDLAKLKQAYLAKLRDMAEKDYSEEMERKTRAESEARETREKELREIRQHFEERQRIRREWAEKVQSGQLIEEQLQRDYQARDIQGYMNHLNNKTAILLQNIAGERAFMETYNQFQMEAHRSQLSYLSEGLRGIYGSLSNSLTNVVMGFQKASDAAKQLGLELVQTVVRWMIQRQLASVMLKTLSQSEAMASASSAASTAALWAAAWSKPAALASLATMGANAAPAMASMGTVMALSRAMAIPALAEGGIVSKPTIALIGERGPEAVTPLGKSHGGVVVNVINRSGTPISADQVGSRFDGPQAVIDIVIDAITYNKGGMKTVLQGVRP